MNMRTWVVTHSNLFRELNLSMFKTLVIPAPSTSNKQWTTSASLDLNSITHSSGMSFCGSISSPISPLVSHSGPLNHSGLLANSLSDNPLDGKSAGFVLPGQCFHCAACTSLLISLTRFCTNGFQDLLVPQIQ